MPERPKLAVIVANNIRGDSRVQKTALAAAYAGWDVTLVGRTPGDEIERSSYGPVTVIRVPVPLTLSKQATERARRRAEAFDLATAKHLARSRRRSARGSAGQAWAKVTDKGFGARRRLHVRTGPQEPGTEATGDWRKDWPGLVDLELAFGPVLEELAPDVIHANDITTLQIGASVAARMRARGQKVAWLYDAHEYVPGVDWPDERRMSAYPGLERDLIGAADAVVTVSPEIAGLLVRDYALTETPLVVRNTPIRSAVGHSDVSVRAAAGLADDVPLLVYSGYIQAQRGIGTAVAALPDLPGVHLAIVTGRNSKDLREILKLASDVDVRDRVHVVPYVAQHQVADYLASADAGVICSQRTINYEMSLPTKLAEYLHARLPVVVSDVQTLAAFVRDHGVGDVFEADDPQAFGVAARTTLAARDERRAHITEEILEDLSWEHQAAGLLDLYTRISGITPTPLGEPDWDVYDAPRRIPGPETGAGLPSGRWRPLGDTPIKLGLGPANFAGQLGAFAQAITDAQPDVSCEVVIHASGAAFGYPADVKVRKAGMSRLDFQVKELERILPRYTHLLADAFRPVFGTLNGTDISGDLPALHQAGIKVALLAHGTDVRHPLKHRERFPASLYNDIPDEETLRIRIEAVERNHRTAAAAGLPLFVTTPDLLADLPTATWAPLVIEVDAWRTDKPVFERKRPIVLHAPSKRWTKGTDRFASQLEELDRRGIIEFQLVEGVPWRTMRERVQDADLVIDQFSVGAYGVFACEAMAAGKPVIAGLSDTVSDVIGEVPPILNCTADQVTAAVEQLLDDRAEAARIGERSLDYVQRLHDGRRTVEALSAFVRS